MMIQLAYVVGVWLMIQLMVVVFHHRARGAFDIPFHFHSVACARRRPPYLPPAADMP